MALIKREAVPAQLDLQRETVSVQALGGDVVVTELSLSDRLDFEATLRGPAPANAKADKPVKLPPRKSVHTMVPHLLALTVLDGDDEPVLDVKGWQAFGARNRDAAIELFNVAMRLSGFNGTDNAKN
jgi:hypothetical protein